MNYKDEFIAIFNKYIKRSGANVIMELLEDSDFFTAPASTRFHECYEGGLCEHSVRVFQHMIRLLKAYPEVKVSGETAAIVCLLHDVCKIGCYQVEMRNKKVNGNWVQEPYYTFTENLAYGGHGSKSVYIIQTAMNLTVDEAVAINCHMGVENGNWAVNDAFRQFPLAFLLHTADMAATISKLNKEDT